jgi:GNAT superfamily N-acetyltransferase
LRGGTHQAYRNWSGAGADLPWGYEIGMKDDPPEQFRIRPVCASDCDHVGTFVALLLTELYPELASAYTADKFVGVAKQILETSQTTFGFLAVDLLDQPVGVVMLNECAAIYAHGRFGEITEIYVSAEYRSAGVGARLIHATIEFCALAPMVDCRGRRSRHAALAKDSGVL